MPAQGWLGSFPRILQVLTLGASVTIMLTLASLLVAALLGFLIAMMQRSRLTPLRALAKTYVECFRNVPVLTQLFILYFGLANVGITLPATVAGILGLGLNGAAFLSEIFRAGIDAVDRGQREAALAIGMVPRQAMRLIVLPQALRILLPPSGSFVIGLFKDTSLASAAAVPELAFRAKMLVSETYLTSQIYLIVALIYLMLSLSIAALVRLGERKLAH